MMQRILSLRVTGGVGLDESAAKFVGGSPRPGRVGDDEMTVRGGGGVYWWTLSKGR